MISQVAYYYPFGFSLPVVAYMGMLTLILLLATASVGFLNFHGDTRIPFKWHPRLARVTIAIALIHAILAVSVYLKI